MQHYGDDCPANQSQCHLRLALQAGQLAVYGSQEHGEVVFNNRFDPVRPNGQITVSCDVSEAPDGLPWNLRVARLEFLGEMG